MADAFNEFQEYSQLNSSSATPLDDTNISNNLNLSQSSPRALVGLTTSIFAHKKRKQFEFVFFFQMLKRIRNVQYMGDPLTLPARNDEIEFLVKIAYRISRDLNNKYATEIEKYYNRNDLIGMIARNLLEPPRDVQTFEKSDGSSYLVEARLKPRINLRWMASYRTIILIFLSLIFGKLIFGGSFFGFFLMILFKLLFIFILSVYEWFLNPL